MSAENIHIIVVYKGKKYEIDTPSDKTLKDLKEQIQNLTAVPPQLQKLIYTRKLNDESKTLKELGIRNNAKLMLVGSTLESVLEATTPPELLPNEPKKATKNDEEEKVHYLSEEKIHKKIIDKGLPKSAEKGDRTRNAPIPRSIKGLYNKRGEEIRLTFKNEEQQLWIASKTHTEKIPYFQIRDIRSEPIHNNEDYSLMGFQIGSHPNDVYWVYFVPTQYAKSIKYTILGGLSETFF